MSVRNTRMGTFKGHPIITIPINETREFSMGKSKARAVILYMPEILDFVRKHYSEDIQEPNINSLEFLYNMKEERIPF